MKKNLLISVFVILFACQPAISNPIMEEDIVTEIYFEDGNWYILFNHNVFWIYGIESFQDISIYTSNGLLIIDPEFMPSSGNAFTVLTVENLLQPVSISPDAGELHVSVNLGNQFWPIQEIKWGVTPYSSVGPVLPGQSINYLPFSYNQMETIWMPIKNATPYFYNGYWNGTWEGTFQGYLYDQNGNPVENAEIVYVSDLFLWPLGSFTPLTTNLEGFFQHDLYAKIYSLNKVIKDNEEFELDYLLNMEPGTTITIDLIVDLSVGMAEIARMYQVKLQNFPNPFSHQTTIELKIDNNTYFSNGVINISNMNGTVLSVIPFTRSRFENNIFSYHWNIESNLNIPDGQYMVSVVMDGRQVANSKMIIAR